jgi:hypothetical protein
MIDLTLHPTTPEIWYKLQRRKVQTDAEIDKITRIYEAWKDNDPLLRRPFTIHLSDERVIHQEVWITGFKTDGIDLFTEYKITAKGPKLTQVIK